jgi:hypothetical protein
MLGPSVQSSPKISQGKPFKRIIAPLLPYLTVGTGLLGFHNVWAAILSYHLAMLAMILASSRTLAISHLFRGGDRLRLPILAAAGACGGLILWLLRPWVMVSGELAPFTQSIGLTQQSWPFFIAYFVLVSPALEELYWRSFLGSSRRSLELNDFLFSGYHLIVLTGIVQNIWLFVIFLVLTAAAWVWRQSNRSGGGLLPSLTSHLAADISIILVSYLMAIRA